MATAPLFIVGTERSGSNLLRLILDSHPSIHIPHPPHIMRYFAPMVEKYGNLQEEHRFRRLVEDVLALVHAHIHPWNWVPTADEVISRAAARDLLWIYAAIHDAVRERAQKPRWGCKSTFMIHVAEAVIARWPEARLIWLYRDPRDVAASSRVSVFSTFHPAYTAQLWRDQQELALAAERAHPGNVLRVRYESLVADPGPEVARICAYLEEDFHPAMLQWFKGDEAKHSASLSESWSNTAAPMRRDRLERWRADLAADDVQNVENIAGPMMDTLGYGRSHADAPAAPVGLATRIRWKVLDRWFWLRVEVRSIRQDRNVWKRWKRALCLLRIRARLAFDGR